MAYSTLQRLVSAGRKTAATTIVFLCLPSNVRRFAFSGRRAVTVELTALTESDARLYLLERAASVGRPDLFAPDALDLVFEGSRGAPRMLRSIASLAFFNAAFDGAPQIGPKHVADALSSQIPSPAPASTASVPDPPAQKPVDAQAAPAWDPPRSELFAAVAAKELGAQPTSVIWLPRLVGAAALAASIAIAAAIPLLMNSMAGSANASKSRPAAALVIPRELGFASVIPISPAVSPKPGNGAETAKQTADITEALEAAAGAKPVVATAPNAPAKAAASAGDEAKAAKDAAYLMNARAAAEAAAQAASLQEAASLPQVAAPAEAATQAADPGLP
jgi:hypothetical protein